MKVFFATDIHGSEICWRKFLNAAAFYKADMVVLGGDVTGKVLVPILAVWLIGKILLATSPQPPLDQLVSEFITSVITFLLVVGLTATALSPARPSWRVLPFTDDSALAQSHAVRRLMAVGMTANFIYVALTRGGEPRDALAAVGALVIATIVGLLSLPVLGNRAAPDLHRGRPDALTAFEPAARPEPGGGLDLLTATGGSHQPKPPQTPVHNDPLATTIRRHAVRQHQCRAGVPQAVKLDRPHSGGLDQRRIFPLA